MSKAKCDQQLTFWKLDKQSVTVDFQGGEIVSDAGLLAVRHLERQLGILQKLAQRLPDPRRQELVVHSVEEILTQKIYHYLAGYFDGNDCQQLRNDPLFQTLADVSPNDQQPLASGSTMNRFSHAYTRREAQRPPEDRNVIFEQRDAHLQRIRIMNDYLVELFLQTRRKTPSRIILDLDATDVETHGEQQLSFFHGYYDQKQYFPLLIFDGESGFPLGAILRHGTAHASHGAVEELQRIVEEIRGHWPAVEIFVRGDTAYAMPELYEFCERENLCYAMGYASNKRLKRETELTLNYAKARFELHEEKQLFFQEIRGYRADSWTHSRRVIAKVEVMSQGTNRRFVVTNMRDAAQSLYQNFYVQRGNIPERPIGELKHGLAMDRLSSSRVLANSFTMLCHVMAYAIVVLFREANASEPEIAQAEVSTLRNRVFKIGAIVNTSTRRIWFHLSSSWPHRDLLRRIYQHVNRFVSEIQTATRGKEIEFATLAFDR